LDKIKDFIQSADPAVRNRAEYELEQVLSDMKYLRKSGMLDRMSKDYHDFIRKNPSDPERSVDKAESSDDETEPAQAHVQASVHGSDAENSIEVGVDVNRIMVPANPDNSNTESVNQYFSQSVVSSWFNSFNNKYGMPIGESLKASMGIEYNYTNRFFIRGGYFIDNNKNLGSMQYFTLGTSFQYQQSKFNISYLVPSGGGITKNPLSNTIRFGSIFYF
jgi:hypothetical protein